MAYEQKRGEELSGIGIIQEAQELKKLHLDAKWNLESL